MATTCYVCGMTDVEINGITRQIIACGIRVHRAFGAGLLESVYDECMVIELKDAGLSFGRERCIALRYKNKPLPQPFEN